MISSRVRKAAAVVGLAVVALIARGCREPAAQICVGGRYCPAGTKCTATGDACITDHCGDGVVQPEFGEVCDDGNKKDNDGCSANCLSDESCGNGYVDRALDDPEVCDKGDPIDGENCAEDCLSSRTCGNGIVEVDRGEECDMGPSETPGKTVMTPICNPNCKWSVCDDGIKNELDNEECDDGPNNGDTRDCLATCKKNTCGDGHLNTDRATADRCDGGVEDPDGGCPELCDEGGKNVDEPADVNTD